MADPQNNDSGRDERGRFAHGNPGGPGGPGRRHAFRRALETAITPDHIGGVVRKLTRQALEGDVVAAKLLIEHLAGRPAEAPAEPERADLVLPDMRTLEDCRAAAEEVTSAINAGRVNGKHAETLLAAIDMCVRALEAQNKQRQLAPQSARQEARVPAEVVRAGFLRFKTIGELPEDVREAAAVVEKVKAGFDLVEDPVQGFANGVSMHDGFVPRERGEDKAMDLLLDEAVHCTGYVRFFARHVLSGFAKVGFDVTAAQLQHLELPVGPVSFHLVGFKHRLARRPYKAQALRLYKRLEKMCDKGPDSAQLYWKWHDEVDVATTWFQHAGKRPSDPSVLEAVLAELEVSALVWNWVGGDVRDVMRLFDVAARTSGDERERAIAELQRLAKDGRFAPTSMAS